MQDSRLHPCNEHGLAQQIPNASNGPLLANGDGASAGPPGLSFAHESREWLSFIRTSLLQTFYGIYFRSTTRAGNFLGKNSLMIFLGSSVDPWIRYQVLPVPSLLMSSLCFIASVCFLLAMVGNTLYMMYHLSEVGKTNHRHFRLSIEESLKYGTSGVIDGVTFGLVHDSCVVSLQGAFRKAAGSSIYLSYPEPVEANGLYIVHNGTYPTKFLLEASEDLQTWSVYGASSKRFTCTGFFLLDWVYRPDIAHDYTRESSFASDVCLQLRQEGDDSNCDGLIFISNGWRWTMLFPIVGNMLIIGALICWIYVSVKTEYASVMKYPLLIFLILCAAESLSFAIIWCTLPTLSGVTQPENSMYAWVLFVLYLLLAGAVNVMYEKYFLSICIIFEILFFISGYVNLWYVYGNSVPVSEYFLASVYFVLIAGFSAVIHAKGAKRLHFANKRFEGFRTRMRQMVVDTLGDTNASSVLDSIDKKLELLRSGRRNTVIQDSPSAMDLGSMRFDLAATMADFASDAVVSQGPKDSHVACLDQLFIQAEMLKPFLNVKVLELAIRNEGMLKSTSGEWLSAQELQSDPEICSRVKWTEIKSVPRIVSKSFCSLEGDCSRLTDICRERIVFEDLKAIRKCLLHIIQDPQIVVMSGKNSMKDCLTSTHEYHVGIVLSVRLAMPQTHSLGISRHACEVQLMLRKFAESQDSTSHEDYVAYRNAFDSQKTRVFFDFKKTLSYCGKAHKYASRGPTSSVASETRNADVSHPLLEESEHWVERFCRSRACHAGNVVSSQLSVIHEAIARASYSSCFFTSTPIAAALCKPVFQMLFCLIGLVYFIQVGFIVYGYMHSALFEYKDFVFTVKQFDGAPLNEGNFTLSSFGLLRRGCRVASASRIVQTSQVSAAISMKSSMVADGWYYELPAGTKSSDIPISFRLEGSQDGRSWSLAGASSFITGEAGWVALSARPNGNLRNKWGYQYNYIPPTIWLVSWLFSYFLSGVLYWIAALSSVLHLSVYVKHIGGMGYLFDVILTLLPIPWLVEQGNSDAAIDFFLRGTCWIMIGYFIRFAEAYWVIVSAFVGMYFMGVEMIIMFLIHEDSRNFWFQFLTSSFIQFGSVMFLFGVLSIGARWRFLLKAEELIRGDRDSYMHCWERLYEDESNVVHMDNLQAIADAVSSKERIRQRVPVDIEQAWKDVGFHVPCRRNDVITRIHSLLHPARPQFEDVECLDQLLAQAEGLDSSMRFLCQRWAAATNGCFPMQGKTFMRWTEVLEKRMTDQVQWAKIKRPLRIIEKTLRSYRHDPSYLCDICRQCIVFETMEDLDVVVERIKNRFVALNRGSKHTLQKETYNSLHSTGYRDVMVNIRVVSDRAKQLGLSWHICELQLLLLDYAKIKSELGHSRYIQWRNTRGE
ncbi:hypothetical protein GUITHDRAFT_121827 [Guillardia theta CCMP2712]|uniref:Uncharacterized protein n=1 Tax=Guillardia theta (strain CCMP2712) TaxID=905079 RepID=L1I6X0_GUITC|nr:hypothetical protein GUITHDRAFT_121827 [Guillardia theta CCMP2712]EKX32008.1 hypothetical protein GUITHDRAFT_121827 [Guillardia theta CCMP2712]|eukprot:XP_005818988.1 hypothetical protein GUITHDRAFT_121827 [Guillardia theta CCMP2712]